MEALSVVDLTNREQLNKKSGKESREERVQRRELISKLVSKRCFRDKIWRQNSLENWQGAPIGEILGLQRAKFVTR